MINVLHTVYWEISLVCCIVTRACGTRDNTGNRLVIFSSTECIIYKYLSGTTNSGALLATLARSNFGH